MIDLVGRRALVTGGSRGIGAAIVRLLAAAGADVAIGYRARQDDAEVVADAVRAEGRRAVAIGADISNRAGAESLIHGATEALGGVDIFVANAGVWPAEEVPVAELADDRWTTTMRENVDSVFYTSRAVLGVMPDGGRIVLISSTAGQRGEAMHADYGASKGAVISFTKSMAVEVAARGITVNSVAPGWVDTEMIAMPMAGDGRARASSGIPLGRIASPEDIAGPVLFLCSNLARHITGEILNVNGGSVLCG